MPGGPQKISDGTRSAAIARRRKPRRRRRPASWPTTSSSVRGRIRSASGASAAAARAPSAAGAGSAPASSNRDRPGSSTGPDSGTFGAGGGPASGAARRLGLDGVDDRLGELRWWWPVPPRSRVRTWRLASTSRAARRRCGRPTLGSPRWCSISTAERISAIGLARFWPAMSGALPCTASKTAHVLADVRARHDAEAADEAGAEVGDDVAVEVLEQQHVELLGSHDELHAEVVDDHVVGLDLAGTRAPPCGSSRGRGRPRAS